MKWREVELLYGKDLANEMAKSRFLEYITVVLNKDGEFEIPEHDIYLAFKDVTGQQIYPLEQD